MTEVPIENLGEEMGRVLTDLATKNAQVVATEIQALPLQFLRAAYDFYPKVLRVRTGRLRQSFEPVLRISGVQAEIGLRSRVEYARIQHEGGRTAQGSYIKPKKFFATPMLLHITKFLNNLKKKITF